VPSQITIEVADLPGDMLALLDGYLLDLGGTYGDSNAGAEPGCQSSRCLLIGTS